jgi:Carboxypeptidase regulatory-like domain
VVGKKNIQIRGDFFVIKSAAVFVLGLLFCTIIARAQSPTAVVNGQVRDTSGAAIPNAMVEVINNATRVHYTTETNGEGLYSVPNLPPGTYRIQVSKTRFKTIVHPDVELHLQDAALVDFTIVEPFFDSHASENKDIELLLTVLLLILTLPIATVATLQLKKMKSFVNIRQIRWRGFLWFLLGWLVRSKLGPPQQLDRVQQAGYSKLIQEQPQMLMMTTHEIAQRAKLPPWAVKVLFTYPDFVPRWDIEKRIRTALMVPNDWPLNGYGKEYVKQRLIWYASKHVFISTKRRIRKSSIRVRKALLNMIEMDRRTRLRFRK